MLKNWLTRLLGIDRIASMVLALDSLLGERSRNAHQRIDVAHSRITAIESALKNAEARDALLAKKLGVEFYYTEEVPARAEYTPRVPSRPAIRKIGKG